MGNKDHFATETPIEVVAWADYKEVEKKKDYAKESDWVCKIDRWGESTKPSKAAREKKRTGLLCVSAGSYETVKTKKKETSGDKIVFSEIGVEKLGHPFSNSGATTATALNFGKRKVIRGKRVTYSVFVMPMKCDSQLDL